MRTGPLLASGLHHALIAPRGLHHLPPLASHQRKRLLAINILARFASRHRHQRMPMIRSRNDYRINVTLL